MRVTTLVFTTTLLAVSVMFLVLATGLASGSRLVPLSVAVPLCMLLVGQVVRDARAMRATSPASVPDGDAGPSPAAGSEPGPEEPPTVAHEAAALGWLLTLAGSLVLMGFLAGPAAWVVLYLRRRGDESWPVALGAGLATAILVWLVMTRVLAAPIAGGWIGSLLGVAFNGSG